jgi:hypothetical protein
MQENSERPEHGFLDRRFTQISESHCGPAVVQMLLSNLGIEVTQEAVAEAGGAKELIEMHGMRVDQLARAIQELVPNVRFWHKHHASLDDLIQVVRDRHYPVGVEWQGLFYATPEEEPETGDDDYGHYSAITIIDPDNERLVIVDPYKDFRDQDRIFSFAFFFPRWYDFNEVKDPLTKRKRIVEDRQMMFVVTPADEQWPAELGMVGSN